MLPVNMCGPPAETSRDWREQHTPPQAPTAPASPLKEAHATLEDAPFKNNDARMDRKQEGRGLWRKEMGGEKKSGNLGYRVENFML